MKIYRFFLIIFPLLSLATTPTHALPDLTISTITFSNSNPEPAEVITISATIHNDGDDSYYGITFSSHEVPIGISSHNLAIYGNFWYAQYFIAPEDLYLGKVSLRIYNYGIVTDSITVEIRKNVYILSNPRPGTGSNNLLAYKTLTSTFTSHGWQNFEFDPSPFLSAGTTYWICLENYAADQSNGYLWRVDSGTPVNMLAVNISKGENDWRGAASGNWSTYFRAYKSLDTLVTFYEGNPSAGGILISTVNLTTPIPSGESVVVSSTWSALSEDSYDIYVAVDYPEIIDEDSEVNNILSKTVIAEAKPPQIISVFPPPDSKGIDSRYEIFAVEVIFSKKMDETKVEEVISLTAVKDNKGEPIPAEERFVSGTTVYTDYNVLTFAPSIELPKGYTYVVKVSTHAEDMFLNHLPEEKIWKFTTVMDHTETNIFTDYDDEYTKVEVGANVIKDSDYYIEIDTDPANDTSIYNKISQANDKIKQIRNTFSYPLNESTCKFTLYKGTWIGTEFTGNFSSPVKITMPYSDQGNLPPIKESTLSIYWLNEEDNLWVKIPGSEINASSNTVTAYVNHFSIYAIMGESKTDLSKAYAYPVPWKPFDGKNETGTPEKGIIFTELGSQATIRIYNISGELVKVLEYVYAGGLEQENWDVTNRNGDPLASGLYIYYIENEKEHKSGKLIIVR